MHPSKGRRHAAKMRLHAAAAAVVAPLLFVLLLLAPSTAAPIPIDSSVVLLFASDVDGGDSSQCAQMVRRAMETGGSSVNFFVTG